MSIPSSLTPLFSTGSSAAAGGYQVSRSLRFNSSDSAFCSRTPAVAGSRTTWTWAGWVKRGALSVTQGLFSSVNVSTQNRLQFNSDHTLVWVWNQGTEYAQTSAVFRDPSAWYHVVLRADTDNASAAQRVQIYVNGVSQTLITSGVSPGTQFDINTTIEHRLGMFWDTGINYQYFNGYLADIHFIDGQALDATAFTEVSATTGQLIPKTYTGTFGTNGFWLKFSDNSAATAATLGKDYSGNSNNWTPNNLSVNTGGPTSVAAASGALPLFNTTDTYGTVKGTGTRTDTNSASIVLALPMDGTNGGTSFGDQSAVIKGSGSAKTVTVTSTTTSTSQYKFYGSSGSFDGTNSILTIANDADFSFGTTDFTVECWVYLTSFAGANGARMVMSQGGTAFNDVAGWSLLVTSTGTVGAYVRGGTTVSITSTNAVSLNAWGHIALCKDANGTSLYINGILGAFSATSPGSVSSGSPFYIGRSQGSGGEYLGRYQGFMNDVRIYKGVAKYTGNFNPPTATIIGSVAAANDSLVDTPTSYGTDTGVGGEVRGNYATFNPLALGSYASLTNGNLDITGNNSANSSGSLSTVGFTSGKYYYEYVASSTGSVYGGVVTFYSNDTSTLIDEGNVFGTISANKGIGIRGLGNIQGNAAEQQSIAAFTYSAGEVIGVAIDADYGAVYFSKSGSFLNSGVPTSGASRTGSFHNWTPSSSRICYPAVTAYVVGSGSASANFGQRAFAYTAPSGFKALCDTNLGAPLVAKPNTVMDVVTYTGNSGTQTLPNANSTPTSLNFSPGFLWIKTRSVGYSHVLTDKVRGDGKILFSNATAIEETTNRTALGTNNFTLIDDGSELVNHSPITYVAWAWDAGTTTASNGSGSITSQVRANVSAGFSIVKFTPSGAGQITVGHGLGASPGFIIVKTTNLSANWYQWVTSLTVNEYLTFTSTAKATSANFWGTNLPSSTVFGYNAGGSFDHIAYCFAPVVGYSSFGSYTGNGLADGPFVYTGFRPRWVMVKQSSASGEHWVLIDTARDSYNIAGNVLYPSAGSSESSGYGNLSRIDILSNGFKARTTNPEFNASATYIYAAFAENPFQYARAR